MQRPIAATAGLHRRRELVAEALRLEWLTLGWIAIEAAVSLGAGIIAHSLTLLAFGADSIIELVSAGVLLWRLKVELGAGDEFPATVEDRAARAGSVLLIALAIYVLATAGWSLAERTGQEFSFAGLAVAVAAIPVMAVLARRKIRIAEQIGSAALRIDAAESIACAYLAGVVVIGLAAQWLTEIWWIDSITSVVLVPFLIHEALEAWR